MDDCKNAHDQVSASRSTAPPLKCSSRQRAPGEIRPVKCYFLSKVDLYDAKFSHTLYNIDWCIEQLQSLTARDALRWQWHQH